MKRIRSEEADKMNSTYEFPREEDALDSRIDWNAPQKSDGSGQLNNGLTAEPKVKVSIEAGNAKVTAVLPRANKEDLSLNCAEDHVTLSVRTSAGEWTKEIGLPFRVDPDTAKAVFRNGKLELVVRKHGRFNPPGPRIDWV